MYRLVLLTGIAVMMSATAASANTGAGFHKKTLRMTPEAIVAGTTVEDDALEFKAVLSTQYAPYKGKKMQRIDDRAYLKAIIDKSSGAVSYEVQQIIRYPGVQRDYVSAQYLAPTGLREVKLADARHGVLDCVSGSDYFTTNCTRTKYVSFSVNESDLKDIAATYQAGDPGKFTFKFKERSGVDYTGGLVAAEVAGMLKAVASYQQSRPAGALPAS